MVLLVTDVDAVQEQIEKAVTDILKLNLEDEKVVFVEKTSA